MPDKIMTENPGSFIADHIGVGLFRYDLKKGKFVFCNKALMKILKVPSLASLKGIRFKNIFEDSKTANSFLLQLRKKGSVKFFKAQLKRNDKKNLWAEITATSLKGKGSSSSSVFIEGVIEDVSDLIEIQEKLEFEKSVLEGLLDNVPDAVYFKDKNNKLIRVNKFYAQGLRRKKEELIGKTDFDFFPSEQARIMLEDDKYVLKTGKPIIGKMERTLLPNGTWNHVVTTKIPLQDNKGLIIGTMGITRDITEFSRLEEEKLQMSMDAIRVISRIHELRDPYTSNHSNRVSIMAERIAQELGWPEKDILGMKIVGQLHDIGKIVVPAEILSKPGKLSDIEYMIIQQHVEHCYNIIKDIKYPFPLAETIYQHHERLDGLGYPRALKRNKIILPARILAVCDVLEAMTYRRPYREALGLGLAMEELRSEKGKKFDANIVNVASRLISKNKGVPFWTD